MLICDRLMVFRPAKVMALTSDTCQQRWIRQKDFLLRTHEKDRIGVSNTSWGRGASPKDDAREQAYGEEICIV